MKKKILTSVLAVSMLISSYTTAFAADDVISATQIGSQAATVTYKDASTFNVTIPKSIHIGSDKIGTYEVKVTGELNDGDVLNVVPSKTVEMTDAEGKASVTAKVGQKKTDFEKEDLADGAEVTTTGTVRSDELSAGAWTGNLSFDIGIETLGTIGADVKLTSSNRDTYGIAKTGDVVIPKWVQDSDGTYHKVTSIDSFLFSNYSNSSTTVTSVVIPDSVTYIGSYAFNQTWISELTLPDSVIKIDQGAFEGCTRLRNGLTLSDNLEYIGKYAFRNIRVSSLELPNSLKYIGEDAFASGMYLESVVIPKNVETIVNNPFNGSKNIKSISVDPENKIFTSEGINGIIEKDTKRLVTLVIEDDGIVDWDRSKVEKLSSNFITNIIDHSNPIDAVDLTGLKGEICDKAFYSVEMKGNLVIPEGITSIGKEAFWMSYSSKDNPEALTVSLPSTLISIGDEAFRGCENMTNINLPDELQSIGDNAFSSTYGLKGTLTIPDSVTSIGKNAFQYTSSNLHLKYNGSATGAPWGCDNAVNK